MLKSPSAAVLDIPLAQGGIYHFPNPDGTGWRNILRCRGAGVDSGKRPARAADRHVIAGFVMVS